jgi:hypothetical protein
MSHIPFKKIKDYLNNELDTEEKNLYSKHLEMCDECRNNILFENQLDSALKDFEPFELPENFEANIIQAIGEKAKPYNFHIKPAIYFAILILVQVIIFFLYQKNIQEFINISQIPVFINFYISDFSVRIRDIISGMFPYFSDTYILKSMIFLFLIYPLYLLIEKIFEKNSLRSR